MMGLLKYGSGVPSYRLEGLEENLGIPLPASTQWTRHEDFGTSRTSPTRSISTVVVWTWLHLPVNRRKREKCS
jgi:hypothetical protein